MDIRDYLNNYIVFLDGGMGTLLQKAGLAPGELPERWNLSHPEVVSGFHRAYYDAGSNVVSTNTFGANALKFSDEELEEIICAAVNNVRIAAAVSTGAQEKFTALDIGPLGHLLEPFGDLDFEEAVSVFAKTVKLGVKYGADLILIETMNDSYETKAALLAAKENSSLPVFVSNAYSENGKLMTGASPAAMVALLEGMGADAIGVNCSLGPKQLSAIVDDYLKYASVPVLVKPNAGLPEIRNGETVYNVSPEEFAADVTGFLRRGARLAGGCCGTTPDYIRLLAETGRSLTPLPIEPKSFTVVSSYSKAVFFGGVPVLIGERINPTGKKRLKQALMEGDIDYLLDQGLEQQEKGVHILDVNVGLPEINEADMLCEAVTELQAVTDLPLQIDTADPAAMEAAMRRYNGKPMVNSVNGKKEVMEAVFPLVRKYGGLMVALTLDETGIPADADGRMAIAKRILAKAREYGIAKKDIIFDPLTMTVSADPGSGTVTLDCVHRIRKELDCHTSLGVSNISFGLPARGLLNSTFFAMALQKGLSAAIMNPNVPEMMAAWHSFRAIAGLDENFADYIAFAQNYAPTQPKSSGGNAGAAAPAAEQTNSGQNTPAAGQSGPGSDLQNAIVKGLKDQAGRLTADLLETREALSLVSEEIIPALDAVGAGYESGQLFLPQLLMSAEAAQAAFSEIKSRMDSREKAEAGPVKCPFVIATVRGDIHDIGKNIVKLILENYGYAVTDLGKDVPPETIIAAVKEQHAPFLGLSALMTTTVPSMEETIRLMRKEAPWCRVIVGGAVLTREYADKMGADKYAKDAMETVRYCEETLTRTITE